MYINYVIDTKKLTAYKLKSIMSIKLLILQNLCDQSNSAESILDNANSSDLYL